MILSLFQFPFFGGNHSYFPFSFSAFLSLFVAFSLVRVDYFTENCWCARFKNETRSNFHAAHSLLLCIDERRFFLLCTSYIRPFSLLPRVDKKLLYFQLTRTRKTCCMNEFSCGWTQYYALANSWWILQNL